MPARKRRGRHDDGQHASKAQRVKAREPQPEQGPSSSSDAGEAADGSQVKIRPVYLPEAARDDPSPLSGDEDGEGEPILSSIDSSDEEGSFQGRDGSGVDAEFSWLEHMDVEAISTTRLGESGEPKQVAYCKAYMIRRNLIRHDFYGEIEQPTNESSMLGFGLFDRYGRLRPEFMTHPVMKGTGVWGRELDHGDMLLIEHVFVNKEYRRQGVGRRMLESLLQSAQSKSRPFLAFIWPTMLTFGDIGRQWDSLDDDAARDEMGHRERCRAVMFCRSLGFRRVGSTIWFALASDKDHPSRQLDAADDYDHPEPPTTSLHPLLAVFQEIGVPAWDAFDSPLNHQPGEPAVYLEALRTCMQQRGATDPCWSSKDKHGNTVLHLAASILHTACVRWILEQDFGPLLLESRNNKGENPLDLLQFKLEKDRTQSAAGMSTVSVSDRFQGYGGNAVRCLMLLKDLGSVESVVELQGRAALLRMDRGCTCGQCLEGFFSSRMSTALQFQAEVGYDMLMHTIDDYSGPQWVEDEAEYLGYLPLSVRENLKTNKSMRQGFINLWMHVATCLENGRLPTEPNILRVARSASEWPPVVRNFLQRGGTVESVVLAICQKAMEQDEWIGDGEYQEANSDTIADLSECRNDLEFGFVTGMCGYRRISLLRYKDLRGNPVDEFGNRLNSLW